ncbi:MAG: hypothetical protein ACRDHY_12420 [Anaerolineales bacterium]
MEVTHAHSKSARANHAMSFNENKAIEGGGSDPTIADDIRSEAWEFAFNEGELFDGFLRRHKCPYLFCET